MSSKIFELKVLAVNKSTGFATLIDPNEIDDVVQYQVYIPNHFGGQTNPWPKPGEELLLRYESSFHFQQQPIQEVWRPR